MNRATSKATGRSASKTSNARAGHRHQDTPPPPTVITLDERVTMPTIAPLHQALCAAFAGHAPVLVDASALVEGDVTLVQVLAAARAEALRSARPFALKAPANSALSALAERAGMAAGTPDDNAFWFHGDSPA